MTGLVIIGLLWFGMATVLVRSSSVGHHRVGSVRFGSVGMATGWYGNGLLWVVMLYYALSWFGLLYIVSVCVA